MEIIVAGAWATAELIHTHITNGFNVHQAGVYVAYCLRQHYEIDSR